MAKDLLSSFRSLDRSEAALLRRVEKRTARLALKRPRKRSHALLNTALHFAESVAVQSLKKGPLQNLVPSNSLLSQGQSVALLAQLMKKANRYL